MHKTIPFTHKVPFLRDTSDLFMQIPSDVHGFLEIVKEINLANGCRNDPYYYYTYPAWSNQHKPLIGEVYDGAYKQRKFFGEGDWVKQTVYEHDNPKIRFWSPEIRFLKPEQALKQINRDWSKSEPWYTEEGKWLEGKITRSHLAKLKAGLFKRLKSSTTLSHEDLENLLDTQIRRICHKF